jgi:hypothetical protein
MSSLSLIDFLIDIASNIIAPNGKSESPYDVNFTNHYVALHDFEETYRNNIDEAMPINHIVQDKKTKTINVEINSNVNREKAEQIKQYCDDHNIEYNINKGKINNIIITKNTKGVLEERKWKKEIK